MNQICRFLNYIVATAKLITHDRPMYARWKSIGATSLEPICIDPLYPYVENRSVTDSQSECDSFVKRYHSSWTKEVEEKKGKHV